MIKVTKLFLNQNLILFMISQAKRSFLKLYLNVVEISHNVPFMISYACYCYHHLGHARMDLLKLSHNEHVHSLPSLILKKIIYAMHVKWVSKLKIVLDPIMSSQPLGYSNYCIWTFFGPTKAVSLWEKMHALFILDDYSWFVLHRYISWKQRWSSS